MKEKFFAQYFEFYKTLKSNFRNTDVYGNKNSLSGRNDNLESTGNN